MTQCSRRSLLISAGAYASIATLESIGLGQSISKPSSSKSPVVLPPGYAAVFLEGPWFFYPDPSNPQQIVAISPGVEGHKYPAGLWTSGASQRSFNKSNPDLTAVTHAMTVQNSQKPAGSFANMLGSTGAIHISNTKDFALTSQVPPNSRIVNLTIPTLLIGDAIVSNGQLSGGDLSQLDNAGTGTSYSLDYPTTYIFLYFPKDLPLRMMLDGQLITSPVGPIHYHFHVLHDMPGEDYASERAHIILVFDQLRQLLVHTSAPPTPISLMLEPGLVPPRISTNPDSPFDPEEAGVDGSTRSRPRVPTARSLNLSNCAGPGGGHGG